MNHITYVLCDFADIHVFVSNEKKQSRNFFTSKKFFFNRIAMYKFVWFKDIFFKPKKKNIYAIWEKEDDSDKNTSENHLVPPV